MLKNENIAKDATLLVTFEITCWLKLKMRPLDASMYLCLHLLQIINNNNTKKVQSKKNYIKRANCAYIGQTR